MLGKADRCHPIGADHQQRDDDVHEGQPVGEVGPVGEGGCLAGLAQRSPGPAQLLPTGCPITSSHPPPIFSTP